jgi:hypothetical protein
VSHIVDMKYEFNLSIFNIQVLSFFGQILCLLITRCNLFLYCLMIKVVRMSFYYLIRSRRVSGAQSTVLVVSFYLVSVATPVKHECMGNGEDGDGVPKYGSYGQKGAFDTSMETGHMQEYAADRLSPASNHIDMSGTTKAFVNGTVVGSTFQAVPGANPVIGARAGGL